MGKSSSLYQLNEKAIDLGGKVLSIIRCFRYLKLRKTVKRNKELQRFKTSEKCFICGLGPSLKHVDFSKLDGDIITVNDFFMFDKNKKVTPNFYCMVDGGFGTEKNVHRLYNAIESYTQTKFILNHKFKNILDKKFTVDNLYYLCDWKGVFKGSRQIDLANLTWAYGNVVSVAIALALYLQYKEIILLGADFNSFASPKSTHCYEEEDNERKINLGFELFCYSFVANTHYELAQYAKSHNINIVNSTPNSLIDAYERSEEYYQ